MASTKNFRTAPDAPQAEYGSAAQLDFTLPGEGVLIGGSLRFEFSVNLNNNTLGGGPPPVLGDITANDLITLGDYCGAHSFIDSVKLLDGSGKELTQITRYGRYVSALYAVGSSFGDVAMSSGKGERELVAGYYPSSKLYALSLTVAANRVLTLEFPIDLLRQSLPLNLMGGMQVSIKLATNLQALYSAATPAVTRYFTMSNAYLTGRILHGADPKSAVLSYQTVTTDIDFVNSGNKSISKTVNNATQATGVVLTFAPAAALSAAGGSEYQLARLPNVQELSFMVGGQSDPAQYILTPVSGGDDSEAIAMGIEALGYDSKKVMRLGNAFVDPTTSSTYQAWYVLGAHFGSPRNLVSKPLTVQIRSDASSVASYAMFMHTFSEAVLKLGGQ